jgi:hypothetical protein
MADPAPPSTAETVMRWVTRGTAVLALVFAVQQVMKTVADVRDRRRQVEELVASEAIQRKNADYEHAWASLDQAVAVAESGGLLAKLTGQLSTEARELRVAQENLAMAWLDNLVVGSGHTFTEVVDRVSPVMARGAAMAGGPRKADLLAHLGYATFLRSRDGQPSGDPESQYREALALDPGNPYAHAYLGHWLLWKGASLDQGRAEFIAALGAGRAKDFVRVLQLAALKNRHEDATYVAVVNDMRKQKEPVDPATRADLGQIYGPICGYREDRAGLQSLLAVTPAAEQAATVKLFLADEPRQEAAQRATREACLATLYEEAGDRAAALDAWGTVRRDAPAGDPNGLLKRAAAGLAKAPHGG